MVWKYRNVYYICGMEMKKVYYHEFTSEYDEWFKIFNILNLENNTYERLYINGIFFNDKLKELSPPHFSNKITYKDVGNYRDAVEYFYRAHTGIDVKYSGWEFMRSRAKGKGNNSFFRIDIRLTIIDRPIFNYVVSISQAIKIFLDTKCELIGRLIINSITLWAYSQPYKNELNLYNEIRVCFGFDKKMRHSKYNIDIERLTDIYIKYINKL